MEGPEPVHGWIVTASQSREIDRLAGESQGLGPFDLMEAAGQAVFREVTNRWPGAWSIAVLAGPGNNGGDGLVVARLCRQAGLDVSTVMFGAPSPTCAEMLRRSQAAGCTEVSPGQFDPLAYDVVVDAVFGTGLVRDISPELRDVFDRVREAGVPVVAIDVPSGIECDTGRALGGYLPATVTVAFGNPKPFMFLAEGQIASGRVVTDPILFPVELLDRPTEARVVTGGRVRGLLPVRQSASHKGEWGKVLTVAGSWGMPGAAILATRAALRSGAGLVYHLGDRDVGRLVVAASPEAILLETLAGSNGPVEFDSIVVGPGLSVDAESARVCAEAIDRAKGTAVLDASALTMVAQGQLAVPKGSILTPHPGEAARLLGVSAREVQEDRWGSARRIAERFGCVCVLKGAGTVVAEYGEPIEVNWSGNPGMASPGMGDVLAGMLGGVTCQGTSAHNAAVCCVYWHGRAGDLAAKELGNIGFLATDLTERLPRTRPD